MLFICEQCGNPFADRACRKRRFCSWACHNAYRMIQNPADRFWAKVDKSTGANGCWLWIGKRQSRNEARAYGRFHFRGRWVAAHRMAYELAVGPIPIGLGIIHSCDCPRCCNPKHLSVGAQKDNWEDCRARMRDNRAKGERVWKAKLTPEQVAEIRERWKSVV